MCLTKAATSPSLNVSIANDSLLDNMFRGMNLEQYDNQEHKGRLEKTYKRIKGIQILFKGENPDLYIYQAPNS